MGNENIIKRMLTLPPTIHGLSRPENFVMDAWQTQGSQTHPVILFLTVHGEFNEGMITYMITKDKGLTMD